MIFDVGALLLLVAFLVATAINFAVATRFRNANDHGLGAHLFRQSLTAGMGSFMAAVFYAYNWWAQYDGSWDARTALLTARAAYATIAFVFVSSGIATAITFLGASGTKRRASIIPYWLTRGENRDGTE